MKNILIITLFFALLSSRTDCLGQQKYKINKYADFSVEEILELDNSVPEEIEDEFDAPLSVSILTYEEMVQAGAMSIPEALRLVPGVIVREMTNGNYDVHIRGLDNVPPNSDFISSQNSTTMVMIDGQPYYNYAQGGILWNALPIDLHDVEKIEVVRGGSSSLYGPNALSGAINIFTKKHSEKGLEVIGEIVHGTNNTRINRSRLSYSNGNRLSVFLSGNWQLRNRSQEEYFNIFDGTYSPVDSIPSVISSQGDLTRDPRLAMEAYGVNAGFEYKWHNRRNLSVQFGFQDAEVQSTLASVSLIPLNSNRSKTYNFNYNMNWDDWIAHLSIQGGDQSAGATSWNFASTDILVERNIQLGRLTLRPGINYRYADYKDQPNTDRILLGEGEVMENFAVNSWFYYDILSKSKLKLLAGVRWDQFSSPDENYWSYQAILSFKPNDQNHFRFVNSLSYRSPFLYDQFADIESELLIQQDTLNISIINATFGNENLDLLKSQLFEFGWRRKMGSKGFINLEAYRSVSTDFSRSVRTSTRVGIVSGESVVEVSSVFQNDNTRAVQTGITASFNYTAEKFRFEPFLTYQKTELQHYSPYSNTEQAPNLGSDLDPSVYNIDFDSTMNHEGTPDLYGGFNVHYFPGQKWCINLNSYFFTDQTFYHGINSLVNDGVAGIGSIEGKFLLNTRVNYTLRKGIDAYLTIKNLTNDTSVEFYGNDQVDTSFLIGMQFKL